MAALGQGRPVRTTSADAASTRRSAGWWPWFVGIAIGAVVLGPALLPGPLLSLDLVVLPHLRVPEAVLGLGDELPRRVPLGVIPAAAGTVIGSVVAGKLFLLGLVAAAAAGAARLAGRWGVGRLGCLTTALLYAAGPFATTRLGAGHWAILAGLAVLPWAAPKLTDPAPDRRATIAWLVVGGLTGVFGGLVTAFLAVAGALIHRPRVLMRTAGAAAVAQLPWLVPSLLIVPGADPLSGSEFGTAAEGPLGAAGALLAQHGFWREPSQVGGTAGWGLTMVGLGLAALAIHGTPAIERRMRKPLTVAAGAGFSLALAPAVPGLGALHASLTSWAPLAPAREPQRFLALTLLWMAPAAVLGARRIARDTPALRLGAPALLIAAAVVLAAPGLCGVGGRLEPIELPAEWKQARDMVDDDPGTTLVLPWHQYLDLDVASGRRVLNPMPDYLPGDVLSSHDPGLTSEPARESADEREDRVRAALPALRDPARAADTLRRLGVDWIVLLQPADWRQYAELSAAPGVMAAVTGSTLELYEVEGRSGATTRRPDWWSWPSVATLAAYAAVATMLTRSRRPGNQAG